jgi:hypothetical protein
MLLGLSLYIYTILDTENVHGLKTPPNIAAVRNYFSLLSDLVRCE